jgi:hypothetical protein
LSTPRYQTVSVTCPSCQNPFVTPVLSIVDVGQNPEAKALLLSGQLNIAVCPQCGHAGALSMPLVYHDPEKELLLTYMPAELGLPQAEQQRIIGDLTNRVISSLPTEKRKGYLLRPREFLRLEGMMEAILEGDGITPEMLAEQRAKADLLERLLLATREDARRAIAQENDDQIDYEFFQLLTLNMELAEANGQDEAAQQLMELREQLLDWTTLGKEAADSEAAIESLGAEITRESLLEKIVEAALAGESVKVETMVAYARPAIDYIFYQQLAERIEAAQKAGDKSQAGILKGLRETILDLTAEIDAEFEQAADKAEQLLQQILESDDPQKTIRTNLQRIDDLFMGVLAANLEAADRSGKSETVEKLKAISGIILALIQEGQPPEIRLINQLLTAEYPEGTQALLEDNRELVDATLIEYMHLLGEDLVRRNRKEAAQRLSQIQEQAEVLVG